MQGFSKWIYFKLLGWEMVGEFPQLDKCVVAVVPHTHWLDFFLGLLVRGVLGEDIHYIAKKSLFKPPFGWFFRWTGGTAVDRSKSNDTVGAIAQIFEEKAVFRLALSPEGTRKKVAQWKTGFYFIAKEAQVPLVLVAFDYGKKQVKISPPLMPTNDQEADFSQYRQFFDGVVGKVPAYT